MKRQKVRTNPKTGKVETYYEDEGPSRARPTQHGAHAGNGKKRSPGLPGSAGTDIHSR